MRSVRGFVEEFLTDPRHHLAVALENDCVIGMASAFHYIHPDKDPELWINEVGVAPNYQRRGLGKALLTVFDGCGTPTWLHAGLGSYGPDE